MSNDRTAHPTTADSWGDASKHGGLEPDEVIDVLSHPYRRHALAYLNERNAVPLDELYAHVGREAAPSANGRRASDHIEITFHHCHLPKLEDAGLIVSDEDGMLYATEAAADLEPCLEHLVTAVSDRR